MQTLVALAWKDLLVLWRDKLGLFWVLGFPLIMAIFFGSIFGDNDSASRSIKIGVARTSTDEAAGAFVALLDSSTAFTVSHLSSDSLLGHVQRGRIAAGVHIVPDTSKKRGGATMLSLPFAVELSVDQSRRAEAGMLEGLLAQAYYQVLMSRMGDFNRIREMAATAGPGVGGTLGRLADLLDSLQQGVSNQPGSGGSTLTNMLSEPPIVRKDVAVTKSGPRSSWDITFPQSLQWSLIGVAAAFAISIVLERVRGTYTRLRLSPVRRSEILLGKGLACFVASLVSAGILLAVGVFAFGVTVVSPGLLALALLASALCFTGLMMTIAVLGKTEQAVAGAGWAILLVFSMLGGGMVPLMFMPGWMAQLASISPVKWSVLALEGAIWRGYGISEALMPLGILVGIGVLGFALGANLLARADNN